eukprot:TRINITY_DN14133_c0_g1_i1.p1 TRINITY_DN14133_c0_g1~~TRINITY_DN14133_c0_g1_i1.p1  ORF type:complete len:1466 (+),score=457.07 TRINITY_DN14133_c0_g1_i1:109-4398(+)
MGRQGILWPSPIKVQPGEDDKETAPESSSGRGDALPSTDFVPHPAPLHGAGPEEKRLNRLRLEVADLLQQMYKDVRRDLVFSPQHAKPVDDFNYCQRIFALFQGDIEAQEVSRSVQRRAEQRLDLMEKQMTHRKERWDARQHDLLQEVLRQRADARDRDATNKKLGAAAKRLLDARKKQMQQRELELEQQGIELTEEQKRQQDAEAQLWAALEKMLSAHGEVEHATLPLTEGLGSVEGIMLELRSERDEWQEVALRLRNDAAGDLKRATARTRQDCELRAQQRESKLIAAHRRDMEKMEERLTDLQKRLLTAEAQLRSRGMRQEPKAVSPRAAEQREKQQQKGPGAKHAVRRAVEQRSQSEELLRMQGEDVISCAAEALREKDDQLTARTAEMRELRLHFARLEEEKKLALKQRAEALKAQKHRRSDAGYFGVAGTPVSPTSPGPLQVTSEETLQLRKQTEELAGKLQSRDILLKEYERKLTVMAEALEQNKDASQANFAKLQKLAQEARQVSSKQDAEEVAKVIGKQQADANARQLALQQREERLRAELAERREELAKRTEQLVRSEARWAEERNEAAAVRAELSRLRCELLAAQAELRDRQPLLGGMLEAPVVDARLAELTGKLQAVMLENEALTAAAQKQEQLAQRVVPPRVQSRATSLRSVRVASPSEGADQEESGASEPSTTGPEAAELVEETTAYLTGLEDVTASLREELARSEERERELLDEVQQLRALLEGKAQLEGAHRSAHGADRSSICAAATAALEKLQQRFYSSPAGRAVGSRAASRRNSAATRLTPAHSTAEFPRMYTETPAGTPGPRDPDAPLGPTFGRATPMPARQHSSLSAGSARTGQTASAHPGTASPAPNELVMDIVRGYGSRSASPRAGSPRGRPGSAADLVAQCSGEEASELHRALEIRKRRAVSREDYAEAQHCAEALQYLREARERQRRFGGSPSADDGAHSPVSPRAPTPGAAAVLLSASEDNAIAALEKEIADAEQPSALLERAQLMLKRMELKTRRFAQRRRSNLARILFTVDHSPLDFPTCPQLRAPTPLQLRVAGEWAREWLAKRGGDNWEPVPATVVGRPRAVATGRTEGERAHFLVYTPPSPGVTRQPGRRRDVSPPSRKDVAVPLPRRCVTTQTSDHGGRPPSAARSPAPSSRPGTAGLRAYTPQLRSGSAAPRPRPRTGSGGRAGRRASASATPPAAHPHPPTRPASAPGCQSRPPEVPHKPSAAEGVVIADDQPLTVVITDSDRGGSQAPSTLWMTRVPAPLKTVSNPYAYPRCRRDGTGWWPEDLPSPRQRQPPPAVRISMRPIGAEEAADADALPITTFLYPAPGGQHGPPPPASARTPPAAPLPPKDRAPGQAPRRRPRSAGASRRGGSAKARAGGTSPPRGGDPLPSPPPIEWQGGVPEETVDDHIRPEDLCN